MGLGRNQRRAQRFREAGGNLGENNFSNNINNNQNNNKLGRGSKNNNKNQQLKYDKILRGIGYSEGGRGKSKHLRKPPEEAD